MPVQGLVRLRKHQFGRQSAINTVVAAKRAYPFSGTPDNELNWTDPEIDAGARVPVAAPHREAPDLTASLDMPSLRYNDLPLLFAAFFGGAETPVGAGDSKAWSFALDATAVGEPDPFSYEFGDDVTTDWFQLGDGILESFEISGPDGLGPLTATTSWRFGSIASSGSTDSPDSPTVPAAGLNVSINDTVVYLKDGGIYIATDPDDLDTAQITDALHEFTLRVEQEVDLKRWANGDQSFDIDAYAGGAVTIELECTFAKTEDTVGEGSESDAWMADEAVNRFVRMAFVSTVVAEEGTPDIPYSWEFSMPMRYYTREEGDIGGNTVVILTGRAFLESTDFNGAFETEVVNTLAGATL